MSNEFKPDATGTVVLSGHEDLALAFDLKSTFYDTLTEELSGLKSQLRAVATGVLAAAGTSAKRVFLRNGRKGGVGITLPDYSSAGNRLLLSDKKMSGVAKIGELGSLGIPLDQLIEEEEVEPGGDVIELRGRWVDWFKTHMMQHVPEGDPDFKYERREPVVKRRLVPEAISKLRALAAAGNVLAEELLEVGVKDFMVRAER